MPRGKWVLGDVMNELFGFGPIQPLLEDPTVTEVMVNRADRVYAERNGRCGAHEHRL